MRREQGFTAHGPMGAALLGGIWFALFLPKVMPLLRLGGWITVLAATALAMGVLLGPLALLRVEGDEGFGCLGILAALVGAWVGARVPGPAALPSRAGELMTVWGAALGPLAVFLAFHLIARARRQE